MRRHGFIEEFNIPIRYIIIGPAVPVCRWQYRGSRYMPSRKIYRWRRRRQSMQGSCCAWTTRSCRATPRVCALLPQTCCICCASKIAGWQSEQLRSGHIVPRGWRQSNSLASVGSCCWQIFCSRSFSGALVLGVTVSFCTGHQPDFKQVSKSQGCRASAEGPGVQL